MLAKIPASSADVCGIAAFRSPPNCQGPIAVASSAHVAAKEKNPSKSVSAGRGHMAPSLRWKDGRLGRLPTRMEQHQGRRPAARPHRGVRPPRQRQDRPAARIREHRARTEAAEARPCTRPQPCRWRRHHSWARERWRPGSQNPRRRAAEPLGTGLPPGIPGTQGRRPNRQGDALEKRLARNGSEHRRIRIKALRLAQASTGCRAAGLGRTTNPAGLR